MIKFSSVHTAIHTAAASSVSNRNSTSSDYRHMHLQIDRPYITLNSEMYITIRQQDLGTGKRYGMSLTAKNFSW